jgi:hypothetical protein
MTIKEDITRYACANELIFQNTYNTRKINVVIVSETKF